MGDRFAFYDAVVIIQLLFDINRKYKYGSSRKAKLWIKNILYFLFIRFDLPVTVYMDRIHVKKSLLVDNAAGVFSGGKTAKKEPDITVLHAKIGQLTLENDFLESALDRIGVPSAKQ